MSLLKHYNTSIWKICASKAEFVIINIHLFLQQSQRAQADQLSVLISMCV
jgi:hypothetical protein